ncbi:MAG: hypothetical protein ACFB9N_13760 [Geitlerinemataceae cyanobacterium]
MGGELEFFSHCNTLIRASLSRIWYYKLAKAGTVTVTIVILTIALTSDGNVLALVRFAWAALAAGLGPLLMLRAWQRPLDTGVGVAMMVGGVLVAVVWNAVLQLSDSIYEALPGMLTGFAIYGVWWWFAGRDRQHPAEAANPKD